MKKMFVIMFVVVCAMMVTSCRNIRNEGCNNKNNSALTIGMFNCDLLYFDFNYPESKSNASSYPTKNPVYVVPPMNIGKGNTVNITDSSNIDVTFQEYKFETTPMVIHVPSQKVYGHFYRDPRWGY